MQNHGDDHNNRQEILFHAKVLYAEKGFSGTSMRDIAQSASVNLSLIYYYFKNKEDLFLSVLEEGFLEMNKTLQKELEKSQDVVEAIRNFIRGLMNFTFYNKYHFQIMQQEILLHGGSFFRSVIDRHEDSSWKKFEQIIKRGIEDGVLKPSHHQLTYYSLIGMMVYYAMAKPVIQERLGMEDYDAVFLEELVKHTTDLFLYGAIENN